MSNRIFEHSVKMLVHRIFSHAAPRRHVVDSYSQYLAVSMPLSLTVPVAGTQTDVVCVGGSARVMRDRCYRFEGTGTIDSNAAQLAVAMGAVASTRRTIENPCSSNSSASASVNFANRIRPSQRVPSRMMQGSHSVDTIGHSDSVSETSRTVRGENRGETRNLFFDFSR